MWPVTQALAASSTPASLRALLTASLERTKAIYATLTGINTSSDRASDSVRALVDAVRSKLERIESLVADAETDG